MNSLSFQTDRRYRLAFGTAFLAGMALCTNGIAHTADYGWTHPVSLLGITLGAAAFTLGAGVLFRRRIGPIQGDRAALFGLLGIIALKFILNALYPLLS